MLILHAGLIADRFVAWAEASPLSSPGGGRRARRGRRPTTPRAEPFPFDPSREQFSEAIQAAGLAAPTEVPCQTAVAWLPTLSGAPVPSSPLIAEPPTGRGERAIAPWIVTGLPLEPARAVDLLCASMDKPMLAPGVGAGRDLAFWQTALRMAASLVVRQQFLPGLVEQDGQWRACWQPVIAGEDAKRLAALTAAMPAIARALTDATSGAPPEVTAEAILRGFLARMVDHLVRSAAAADNLPATAVAGRGKKPPRFDSLHDQWLHCLRTPDGIMEGDPAALAGLADQIRQWQRPIMVSIAAPMRLCFRLEEPVEEADGDEDSADTISPVRRAVQQRDGQWQVRYLLQGTDDPSLLVPVADAWKPGRKPAAWRRGGFNAQEYLLAALGQAAGVCPRIEASLKTARPDGYAVDATGAYEFLSERAAALEQAGFGVLLPAWWTRKGTKLRLSVQTHVKSPKMAGGSGMSLEDVVTFDWRVALGEQTLTLEELESLAALKEPLVKVRGQWVQMTAEEIQTALDYWKAKGSGTATVRQVVQMALGEAPKNGGIAFTGIQASGWIGELLDQLEGRGSFGELPPPSGFVGTLRPYQNRGYSWLAFLRRWGLGACLADDMGLGKTVQTLALIQRDWEANGRRPVLLICPTSVIANWQKEAARFAPRLPLMVHHGVGRAKQGAFAKAAARQAIVVSSYALLHRDLEHLQEVPWAGVVLDEAQNIKNPETKQARAARSLSADYRIALTGTPVENHVGDLWSIMEFLNPGFLGAQAAFKRQFFIPIQAGRDPEAAERLKKLTGPFILRRLKTDRTIISDLPEKNEMKVFCTLTAEQASLYTAVLKDAERALGDSGGIQRKGLILGMLSKLKQVCNHPAQFLGDNSAIPGRSGKLARLTEMLEEAIEAGDRALVFSQFTEMGEILRRHLVETFGREVLFLHGGVPKRQRDQMVDRFQSEDGPPVFLLSLKAGGTGLNLTRASHVFHFDRWWNPAVENQATDRAFRIGQTKNVQVHKYVCVGTFEEKIDAMIESKKAIAQQVVAAGEGWLTEMSNAQLKDVFALRKEAVGE